MMSWGIGIVRVLVEDAFRIVLLDSFCHPGAQFILYLKR